MSVWKATEEMYKEKLLTGSSKCQIHFMFGYSAVSEKKKFAVMWWWENQQKLLCKSFFQGTVPSKQVVK